MCESASERPPAASRDVRLGSVASSHHHAMLAFHRSLRLDQVLSGIALAFVAGEVLLSCAAMASFAHDKRD